MDFFLFVKKKSDWGTYGILIIPEYLGSIISCRYALLVTEQL